ncbi:ABC-F family ATP-binding cassette domain-containing protein [Anoxynatronum sibiricum]|uniref:ABC-F family ATP-binding cassette domain-containing protein n=1 Tax=Anoxynatronum sibiricum TaxID=210623 RepID=A0ABU9VXH9_9CLOT
MNQVTLHQVTHHYGIKLLLKDVTFHVTDDTRLGLIGINGTGKTTLLRILAGALTPESGEVAFHPDTQCQMVDQDPQLSPELTVLEAAFQGGDQQCRLVLAYQQTLNRLQEKPDEPQLQQRLLELQQQMDSQNAWDMETQARVILTRLGLPNVHARVETLSGGQRRRIALAGALIRPASLLILDEPTNHLDLEMIEWLETYLQQRKGALVMVTHDRYFLDRVVNQIGELEDGTLTLYSGSYSEYLTQKEERMAKEAATQRRLQTLFKQELAWIRRGARARTTKQKARIQRFDHLEESLVKNQETNLDLPVLTHRLGKKVMELKQVSVAYEGQSPVIQNFNLLLKPGEIVGLAGPNGSGKSTLMKLMAGELEPVKGTVERGETVRLAFFRQENQELNAQQRVLEYMREGREVITLSQNQRITASQMLERFLFSPEKQWTTVGSLSGGEKRRLLLLRRLMEEPNLLLLDEPTNDLDVVTLAVLEDYIDQFPGTVVIASHDRYLMDRLADRLIVFGSDGSVTETGLSCSEWLKEQRSREKELGDAAKAAEAERTEKRAGTPNQPLKRSQAERPLKFTYKEQQEYDTIEERIVTLEKSISSLEEAMLEKAADFQFLETATAEKLALLQQMDALLERWTYLSEKAETIAEQ